MLQDYKKDELKRLEADLSVAINDAARSEIKRRIAFAEAIIRMRDGADQREG